MTLRSDSDGTFEAIDLKISRADVMPYLSEDNADADVPPTPGLVLQDEGDAALRIATGDGWLLPLVVQRAGGKALAVEDFLRGFPVPADVRCAVKSGVKATSNS